MDLIYFDKAKTALAKATKIDDVKQIRDKAEALRAYARQSGESLEMQNQCAEIKLRAERRGGELIAKMPKQHGGKRDRMGLQRETPLPLELKDVGISKIQSHRWQKIAGLPQQDFESHIGKTKDRKQELTTVGVLRLCFVMCLVPNGKNGSHNIKLTVKIVGRGKASVFLYHALFYGVSCITSMVEIHKYSV